MQRSAVRAVPSYFHRDGIRDVLANGDPCAHPVDDALGVRNGVDIRDAVRDMDAVAHVHAIAHGGRYARRIPRA